MNQPLLTTNDLAERLGVSRRWVQRAADEGRLPAIRLGSPTGPLRFDADQIDQWLEEQRANWTPGKRA